MLFRAPRIAGNAVARGRSSRQRSGYRLGIIGVGVDRLADQPFGRRLEVHPEIGMHVGKLPPDHGIEKPARRPHHDRGLALARIAVGFQVIAAAECDEQPDRPGVGHGEFHFLGRVLATDLGEFLFQPFGCRAGGILLACGCCAEIKGFDLFKPFANLLFDHYGISTLNAFLPGAIAEGAQERQILDGIRKLVVWKALRRYTPAMNEEDEKRIAAKLAKIMAMMCVRNTSLEDLHAGLVPVTRTGDYSDVVVRDADGREIPWSSVSHIDDDHMRALMRQVVNRLYTFHLKTDDPAFRAYVERWTQVAEKWDEPELDFGFAPSVDRVDG